MSESCIALQTVKKGQAFVCLSSLGDKLVKIIVFLLYSESASKDSFGDFSYRAEPLEHRLIQLYTVMMSNIIKVIV